MRKLTGKNTHQLLARIVAIGILLSAWSVSGCKKHGDLPAPLGVSVPPTVTNLVVNNPQALDYDISWDIADPSVVRMYRVYAVVRGLNGRDSAELADSTTSTSFLATLAIPIAGVRFGVTVVTLENVEGAMVVAAPQ